MNSLTTLPEKFLPPSLDTYQIKGLISQIGTETIYRAQEKATERPVLIRIWTDQQSSAPDYQRRFVEQGLSIAELNHPHILKVHQASGQGELLILITDDPGDETLRTRLDAAAQAGEYLDLRWVVSVARQVAQALHYAHEQGLIHHDIKPEAIRIRYDALDSPVHALLTNFGLARSIDAPAMLVNGTEILGTLAYMAPEQLRGEALDGRYDIYALGAVLYEMVTGQSPFPPDTTGNLILMQTQGEPIQPQDLRPSIPPALVSIILRAIRKNPDERYDNAALMARELEALERSIKPLQAETIRPMLNVSGLRPASAQGAATVFEAMPVLDFPAIPVDLVSEGTDDCLIVMPPSGAPWVFSLEKLSFVIGRDAGADLRLDEPRVSRRHARVDRLMNGRITITDLGSSNGTYAGQTRIGKDLTAIWADGSQLKIGPYWITLRLARAEIGIGKRLLDFSAAPPSSVMFPDGLAEAKLSPTEVVIEPGKAIVVKVEIHNRTSLRQTYQIDVENLRDDWFTIPSLLLEISPRETAERLITLHPLRVPNSSVRPYAYTVVMRLLDTVAGEIEPEPPATEDSTEDSFVTPVRFPVLAEASLQGRLQVFPYYEFTSDVRMRPNSLRIAINNQGNSTRAYVVEVREPANMLIMMPARTRLALEAGRHGEAEIKIQPKLRPLLGVQHEYPVDVYIRSEGLPPQQQRRHFVVKPLVEWWALAIGLILLSASLFYLTVNLR